MSTVVFLDDVRRDAQGHGVVQRRQRDGVVAIFVAAILLIAAVGKLVSPGSLFAVLESTWGLGHLGAQFVYLLLLEVEFGIAAGLLYRRTRALSLKVALAFFLLVSLSPLVQLWNGSTEGCGCGLGIGGFSPTTEQIVAIVRNGVIVSLLVPFLINRR